MLLMGISRAERQIDVDMAKLQQMLGVPDLAWLVDRIRRRLERGELLDGTLTLVGATPDQCRAASRLLGRSVGKGTSLSVPLPELATRLRRTGAAPDLAAAAEAIGGPVRHLADERAAGLQRWDDALGTARSSWLSHLTWFRDWLSSISRDGTVTRLIRQGHGAVIGQAIAVLEKLPGESDDGGALLSALAAAATGDEHALSEGPLPALVLRALAAREGVDAPASPDAAQALWSAAGVVADDLASQVLVLNLRAGGEPVGRWLTEAADAGHPFRLTSAAAHRGPRAALGPGDLRVLEHSGDAGGSRRAGRPVPGARLHGRRAIGSLRAPAAIGGQQRIVSALARRLQLAGTARDGDGGPAAARDALADGGGRLSGRGGLRRRPADRPR